MLENVIEVLSVIPAKAWWIAFWLTYVTVGLAIGAIKTNEIEAADKAKGVHTGKPGEAEAYFVLWLLLSAAWPAVVVHKAIKPYW